MLNLLLPLYADAEVPQVIGGAQLVVQNVPAPPASLQLFRNGLLLRAPDDFQLAGQAIVLTDAPAEGDVFLAYYRY